MVRASRSTKEAKGAKAASNRSYRSRPRTAPGVAARLQRLGARIRELRLAAKLTQERAAHAADLTVKQVNLIEAGKTNPTVATLFALAKAISVDVGAFFEGV